MYNNKLLLIIIQYLVLATLAWLARPMIPKTVETDRTVAARTRRRTTAPKCCPRFWNKLAFCTKPTARFAAVCTTTKVRKRWSIIILQSISHIALSPYVNRRSWSCTIVPKYCWTMFPCFFVCSVHICALICIIIIQPSLSLYTQVYWFFIVGKFCISLPFLFAAPRVLYMRAIYSRHWSAKTCTKLGWNATP